MRPSITIGGYLWLNVFTTWVTGIWNIVIPRQLPFVTVMCENKIVYATQGHWNTNLDIHVVWGGQGQCKETRENCRYAPQVRTSPLSKMVADSAIRGKKFVAERVSSIREVVPALGYEQETPLTGGLVNASIGC
ncbi:hypothetical protein BGW80DRAFT_1258816 [Lactifluus volemus]|nr:hypothetical protein BGW80DRAFT_1258816 [Lactifluus volemus]